MANTHEAFERLLLMQKLVKAKQFDALEETIDDALWAVAPPEWKEKERLKREKKMDRCVVIGMFTAMKALCEANQYEAVEDVIEKTLAAAKCEKVKYKNEFQED